MAKPKFKYNIHEKIQTLPREVAIGDLEKILEKEGVSRDTFYRDKKILINSDQSIPSDRLFIYADLFECDVHDLCAPRKAVQSIRKRLLKKQRTTRVKIKSGLS